MWLQSDEHALGVVPVEVLSGNWELTAHTLEETFLDVVLRFFDGLLVVSLRRVDQRDDSWTVRGRERNVFVILFEVELDVSCLVVMAVDFDATTHGRLLSVN